MKKLGILTLAGLSLLAVPARAVIINLGSYPTPSGGESAANELAFLNSTVIPTYNLTNPDLPNALPGTQNIDVGGELTQFSVNVTGFEYVKLKWGQQWQFYYVAGEEGPEPFSSTVFNQNNQPQALSHYTLFNATVPPGGTTPPGVPDGGLTVLMLGAGLTALAYFRRRMHATSH